MLHVASQQILEVPTVEAATRRHDYRNYIARLLDMAEISLHRCPRNISSHVVSGHGLERRAIRVA